MPQPTTDQIHVLVVVPDPDESATQRLTPERNLLQAILPPILTNAPTTPTDRNLDFQYQLYEFYGCYRRKDSWIRCMLLDAVFPKSLVTASHLFRRSNAHVAFALMQISDIRYQISDIDDEKNGLLLFKPLKHALDHFQISFIRDDAGVFRLKLFDPRIRDTCLVGLTDCEANKVLNTEQAEELPDSVSLTSRPCDFDIRTTFGDVDGTGLTFTGLERPFYRCLNLQARVARYVALKKEWIDPSYDFGDFWTDVFLDDKMEMLHRSLLDADVAL